MVKKIIYLLLLVQSVLFCAAQQYDTLYVKAKIDSLEKVLESKNQSSKYQNQEKPLQKNAVSAKVKKEKLKYELDRDLSVALNFYELVSPGISVSKRIKKSKFYAKAGFNSVRVPVQNSFLENVELPDTIAAKGKTSIGRVKLGLDYFITNVIYATGGVQYNIFETNLAFGLKNNYSIDTLVDINGTSTKNDDVRAIVTIPKELIGNIRVDIKSAKFAPFLGFGFKYYRNNIGVGLETGLVFQGTMIATLQEKNIDTGINVTDNNGNLTRVEYNIGDVNNSDSTNQEIIRRIEEVNKTLENYSFLPYLSLNLNYKIK